jgi:hypothetical protein
MSARWGTPAGLYLHRAMFAQRHVHGALGAALAANEAGG